VHGVNEKNKPIKQGTAGFWSAPYKLVVGTTDRDNGKNLEILSNIYSGSIDTERSSDGRSDLDDLFELMGAFCASDSTFKPKTGVSVKHHTMKSG